MDVLDRRGFRSRVAGLCLAMVVAAACGSGSGVGEEAVAGDDAEEASGPAALTCPADLNEVVALLRSGLPTYDYDPAVDLADLVGRNDVVVAGEIESIERVVGDEDADTVISVRGVEVLAGSGAVEQFSTASWWAARDEPDPLGVPVAVVGVRIVAFLDAGPWPGGYTADLQGLVVGCDGQGSVRTAIEGLPPDAAGLSLDGLIEAMEVGPDDQGQAGAPGVLEPLVGDGELIAVTDEDSLVAVNDLGETSPIARQLDELALDLAYVASISLSEDRTAAFVGVRVLDAGDSNCSGAVAQVTSEGATVIADGVTPVVSPDQTMLVYGTIERDDQICYVTGLEILELATGATSDLALDRRPDSGGPDWNLSWLPDSQEIVVADSDGGVRVIDVESGERTGPFAAGGWAKMPTAFAPGELLVMTGCCTGDMTLSIFDLAAGTLESRFDLAAPVETLTIDNGTIIATDALGTLLIGDADGLRSVGVGFEAADR